MSRRSPLAAIAPLVLLAGCAAGGGYPSLAPRPIEEVSLAEPVPRPVPPATSNAVANARFAPIVGKARDGDAAFRRRLAAARPTLAAGRAAPLGSDAWGAAQQALSRLQEARAPVVAALTALETESEAPAAAADRGLADAAARALETVRAIDAEEARALAEAAPMRS